MINIYYSPNISVENVNRKEIRDVRSVVLEIREVSAAITTLHEDPPAADPVRASVSQAVWKSEALEALKMVPEGAAGGALSDSPQKVDNRLVMQSEEEESRDDDEDENDKEERKSLQELRETSMRLSLLRQGKEVKALGSKSESIINKKLQGKMIGRVVVVNEVFGCMRVLTFIIYMCVDCPILIEQA